MLDSDEEQELYKRAQEATNEALRQGDVQLRAAAAASRCNVYYPVATPVACNPFSLEFEDKRLESIYCRRLQSPQVSFTCELAVCILRLWTSIHANERQALMVTHICVAAFCTLILIKQSKWYQHSRVRLFVILLWCWEGLQLYFATNNNIYLGCSSIYLASAQYALISFLYPSPFCIHMRLRGFGCACQALVAFASKREMNISGFFIGHAIGTLTAYVLDRHTRIRFLKSLPNWVFSNTNDDYEEVYPELLVKPQGLKDSLNMVSHRALGGFAGGFGGVSGLKCTDEFSQMS